MTIYAAAKEFEKFLDIEYKIKLGRKGKITSFTTYFKEEHFFHLAGLHKLTDVDLPTKNKKAIFKMIINKELPNEKFMKSVFYDQIIDDRVRAIYEMEDFLDSEHLVFKFNKNRTNWTKIKCKFILESNIYSDNIIYLFLDSKKDEKNKMFGCSYFKKSNSNYTSGSTSMALLYKEKIHKSTGERIIQVNKLK